MGTMREILFRGKRMDNGEWVEGYLLEDKAFYGKQDRHSYIVNHEHPSSCFGSDIYIEVDPATVGQFTGLTANGKRIFEGDIVRVYDTHNVKVTFDEGCFHVEDRIIYVPAFTYPEDAYEVIGSVHDNPELLEGGENDG